MQNLNERGHVASDTSPSLLIDAFSSITRHAYESVFAFRTKNNWESLKLLLIFFLFFFHLFLKISVFICTTTKIFSIFLFFFVRDSYPSIFPITSPS